MSLLQIGMPLLSTTDYINRVLKYWYVLEVIEKFESSFIKSDERPIRHNIHSLIIARSRNLQKAWWIEQVGRNTSSLVKAGLHPSAVQRLHKSQVIFLHLEVCCGFSSANFSWFSKSWKYLALTMSFRKGFLALLTYRENISVSVLFCFVFISC